MPNAQYLLVFAVFIAAFYFMMIRPENKRKKKLETMRKELAIGDEVTTIGGVVGTVCSIKNDMITIETGGDRVRVQFAKWAISNKGFQTVDATERDKKEKK